MKRELVMLAQDYNPLKHRIAGSYVSLKLDGIRAIWLPHTRGLKFQLVPWANKDRDDRDHICTGLWTRLAKPIMAPDWFLDSIPQMPMDGELYMGRGKFNATTSCVKKLVPVDSEWEQITYNVFDLPSYKAFYSPGRIRIGPPAACYEYTFTNDDLPPELGSSPYYMSQTMADTLVRMESVPWNSRVVQVKQTRLPMGTTDAQETLDRMLEEETSKGGEGLMVRTTYSSWKPNRVDDLFKLKKLMTSKGTVIGYKWGQGKLAGMVGAFRLQWGDSIFDLSGFTEQEREVSVIYQGPRLPDTYTTEPVSQRFPIGSEIPFCYNELTPDGQPRFPRFLRSLVSSN